MLNLFKKGLVARGISRQKRCFRISSLYKLEAIAENEQTRKGVFKFA